MEKQAELMRNFAQKKDLETQLTRAVSYKEWHEIASEHDRLSGADDWRRDERTPYFHEQSVKSHIYALRKLREAGGSWKLLSLLKESLFRYQGELVHADLYGHALCGTKYLVSEFLDEVEACLLHLSNVEVEGYKESERLAEFKRAGKVYGRPALMLSGGATFGMFHLGVAKALLEENLLPRTISGSSMGAIMGAMICTRTDEEVLEMFENVRDINRQALKFHTPMEAWEKSSLMDQTQVLMHIRANSQSMTFQEAMQKSKRILNVTVSPTRKHQTPKLLNYLSSPDVLVEYAALASSAIPGMFKPVQLKARRLDGRETNWMSDERWCDGSVAHDLPKYQLTQMLNINHHITSQTNPHVIPFGAVNKPHTFMGRVMGMGQSIARNVSSEVFDFARRHAFDHVSQHVLDKAYQVTSQSYQGDINIVLPFKPGLYPRLLKDPSQTHLEDFIRSGEISTYPQIPRIRDRTRISRVFGDCIGIITERIKACEDT